MKFAVRNQSILVFLVVTLILPTGQVLAFYERQSEQLSIDARGFVRGFANAILYPDDPLLYPEKTSSGLAGIARLMIDMDAGDQWRFEFNAYQTYIPNDLATQQSSAGLPVSVERSALFATNFSNQEQVYLALDRFSWRWSKENFDLSLGRQAINLATTFYFTPNDFFAPFSAQTFYRVYKPGVDALRAELALGDFAQLSVISVLGYRSTADSDTGWSDKPDSERGSHLLRWSNAYGNLDTTLIAGRVVRRNIIGTALQGEFFEWLGVRFAGHYAKPQSSSLAAYQQFSLGIEHRWENSLELRWELFYNGQGGDRIADYISIAQTANTRYLARRYSAFGGSYNITPLLIGQAVIISNLDDQSQLLSLNVIYSLSDESEMVVNVALPVGDKPDTGVLQSEFGAYPLMFNIETRLFF